MTDPSKAHSSDYTVIQSPRPLPLAAISSLLKEFYSGVLSFGEARDSGGVSDDLTASSNMAYGAPGPPGRAVQIQNFCSIIIHNYDQAWKSRCEG